MIRYCSPKRIQLWVWTEFLTEVNLSRVTPHLHQSRQIMVWTQPVRHLAISRMLRNKSPLGEHPRGENHSRTLWWSMDGPTKTRKGLSILSNRGIGIMVRNSRLRQVGKRRIGKLHRRILSPKVPLPPGEIGTPVNRRGKARMTSCTRTTWGTSLPHGTKCPIEG